MKRILALLAVLLAVLPLNAQRRDSVYTASEQFKFTKLIAPVTLVTLGSVFAFSPWYQNGVNVPVRDWMQSQPGNHDFRLDNYTQFMPIAAYGIAAASGAGKHSFWEQLMTGLTSYGLMIATVQIIKKSTANPRPDTPNKGLADSFPSGHTATAFLGAELIRLEYGPWWGLAAYSVAITTGFLRVWNNWHWTSDVIAGAGVGILCANAAYWLLPLERKLFHLDSKMVNGQHYRFHAVPYAASTPYGSCFGVSLAYTW